MSHLPPDPHRLDVPRHLGSGYVSGVLALVLSLMGLAAVLCLLFPGLLTVADARDYYNVPLIRFLLHLVLIAAFALGVLSVVLCQRKILGTSALIVVLLATLLGGSHATNQFDSTRSDVYLGLDWFILNLVFTGIVFIPIERLWRVKEQPIFRYEWREDLLYFLISSLLVQALTFLSTAPALALLHNTDWAGFRKAVASQPTVLQFFEIMLATDLVQYWVHRGFHRSSILWRFHSVHHSARAMDWLAGSRMHFLEIIVLRGTTVVPMYVLGFSQTALFAYVFFVYVHSTFVHSNLRVKAGWLEYVFVTPRFHHWHHGIEKEAIDVNFAVHFPVLDMLFGTFHYPADGNWPAGYGIKGHPVPKGYLRQFVYPFTRDRAEAAVATADAAGQGPKQEGG